MNEEILESFIEAVVQTFDIELSERDRREVEAVLKEEFFQEGKIIHPELNFIVLLYEMLQAQEDSFYE